MNRFFLGITLGGDPHTLGAFNAGKIARMLGIDSYIIPPDAILEEKLALIAKYNPKYLGLSYRLSIEKGIEELVCFLDTMHREGFFGEQFQERRICFAALPGTLKEVRKLGLQQKYSLHLLGLSENESKTVLQTIHFFEEKSEGRIHSVLETIRKENGQERMEILDQIAADVIEKEKYRNLPPLNVPSAGARRSMVLRRDESPIPLIRTHFGVPSDTIDPTVEGIQIISRAQAVDEISLGSSDLSQRYFGRPAEFEGKKNDGGVPYKTKKDLERLYHATRCGNFPALKPYCHVQNMTAFADTCIEAGLLTGAHQAVPLFWFSELDGRGPLSVEEAVDQHIGLVKYLKKFHIPVEMNDPNQWSSRFCHDTIFVSDYALIASVMYEAGIQNMVFQFQFNKPAVTGDYGDLSKMSVARDMIEYVRPYGNRSRILVETRAGIEHFKTHQPTAKRQLARSTLLQMLMNPDIVHLVSYCEADHAATPDDIIESSQIVRRAICLFRKNENDIRKLAEHDFIEKRKKYLISEAKYLLDKIAELHRPYSGSHISKYLSAPSVLKEAMRRRYMTAPGIMNSSYVNSDIITKPGSFGGVDCYGEWDARFPLTEEERLRRLGEK